MTRRNASTGFVMAAQEYPCRHHPHDDETGRTQDCLPQQNAGLDELAAPQAINGYFRAQTL
jgi:hypothetical protein